jgi:hypothetical protein
LIVFDNVEPTVSIDAYLPKTGRGSIVVTCRKASVAYKYSPRAQVPLDALEPDAAAAFLLDRLRRAPYDHEFGLARQIAQAVGGLPLALDLIGNYIRGCGKSLVGFLSEYPRFQESFIFSHEFRDWSLKEHQQSIGFVWEMNLSMLDNPSKLFVQMLAFLDGDSIPTSLFSSITQDRMCV